MNVAVVTGSGGLIGSEAVRFLSEKFDIIVGIDNDMRSVFFGSDASTNWNVQRLKENIANYVHKSIDIRNSEDVSALFSEYGNDIKIIVHAAAQPSHDWAARDPIVDFTVNANGTLILLEATRFHCPKATFIHCSTNKVYGDTPNHLPLEELDTRWEINNTHSYYKYGIDEAMSIDQCKHSLFGASKASADLLVQEYGRYFGMNTGVFRGGCLTGPMHSGTELHGFLSYLIKCCLIKSTYNVFGYKGKQVRDNIHSHDLVNMFWHFHRSPRPGEVYNAGGSRHSNCSLVEAVSLAEEYTGNKMNLNFCDDNRIGDHIWYISSVEKFKSHYPDWDYMYNINDIVEEICEEMSKRV